MRTAGLPSPTSIFAPQSLRPVREKYLLLLRFLLILYYGLHLSYSLFYFIFVNHISVNKFTSINPCDDQIKLVIKLSSCAVWQLRKKKKKKKKKKKLHDNEKDGAKNSKKRSDDESEEKNDESDGYLPLSFFGVYDGHGGSLCVETVCARLHKYIINQRTRSLFFLRDPDLINDMLYADRPTTAILCPPSLTFRMCIHCTQD